MGTLDMMRRVLLAMGVVAVLLMARTSAQTAQPRFTVEISIVDVDASVIVSGSPPGAKTLYEDLLAEGLSPARIIVENASETTRQQAINVGVLLRSRRLSRVILIASVIHMPRALSAFRVAGVDAITAAGAGIYTVTAPTPALVGAQFTPEGLDQYRAVVFLNTGLASPLPDASELHTQVYA